MVIGGGLSWTGYYGLNQGAYQRFLAVPSRHQRRTYLYSSTNCARVKTAIVRLDFHRCLKFESKELSTSI